MPRHTAPARRAIAAFGLPLLLLAACTGTPGPDQPGTPAAYNEAHRPQFHFSPPQKWMNDPNGMFYLEGEYHLFYQYYPDSTVWGPMHWGHAVSTDLVHWTHLPVALYPDTLGYIFSGSAVVDRHNTSGLGQGGTPPIVAVFTYHHEARAQAGHQDFQYQGIAFSTDKGRTWHKYPGNPVLPNTTGIRDFRDPKVIWHEASRQWVMALAVADHVQFWGSPNLLQWTHLSDFGQRLGSHGGVWECPDLFPLAVQGEDTTKWVLLLSINPGGPNGGSATQYFVGDFDGRQFTPDPAFAADVAEERAVWLDHGRDNYAGVTWSDIPPADGRRLFMGWMSNWDYATVVPTATWRSAMTLPRELYLHRTPQGYRLQTRPARELRALRTGTPVPLPAATLPDTMPIPLPTDGPLLAELIIELELPAEGAAAEVGVELLNDLGERYRVYYDRRLAQWVSDRRQAGQVAFSPKFAAAPHTAPRPAQGRRLSLHLFIDRASAELFADDGMTCLTDIFFPNADFNRVRLFANGGTARLLRGEAHALRSVW